MFCTNCGTQLPDDAILCIRCGNEFEDVKPSEPLGLGQTPVAATNKIALLSVLKTGIKLRLLFGVTVILLICCMVIPLALDLPIYLSLQGLHSENQNRDIESSTYFRGAITESIHTYEGFEYSALFEPLKLNDSSLKSTATIITALAGPLLITGSNITLEINHNKKNNTTGVNSISGSAKFALNSSTIVGISFFIVLLLSIAIVDFGFGDTYGMQKFISAIFISWAVYCVIIKYVLEYLISANISQTLGIPKMSINFNGFSTAPTIILIVCGLYWFCSIFLNLKGKNYIRFFPDVLTKKK